MTYYTSELSFEFAIRKLIKSLKTNQPYNLFCHQVSDEKVEDVNRAIEQIKAEGLKCNYQTTSRTITFIGSTDNYQIEKISNYFYTINKAKTSNTILFAIPKKVKTQVGTFDYSTPFGIVGDNDINAKHSILDHTFEGIIDKKFILATLYINKKDHKFGLEENLNHMLKNGREKTLNNIREKIEEYVSLEGNKSIKK